MYGTPGAPGGSGGEGSPRADGADPPETSADPAAVAATLLPGRRRGRSRLLVAGVAVAAAGVLLVGLGAGLRSSAASGAAGAGAGDAPTPGVGAAPSRRGAPEALRATSGSYTFERLQPNRVEPVAFDPCREIHWTMRPDGAPPGGVEAVEAAVARMGRATGLAFVRDPDVDEAPSATRAAFQPQRYGDRWAPILVAWSDPGETPGLMGGPAGMGAASVRHSRLVDHDIAVTGQVILDGPQLTGLAEDPATAMLVPAIVLHEFGHVLGLGHVDDPSQLMAPAASPLVTDLAAGDLTGLARLGGGVCAPDL